jgi:hypothetical protein
VRHKLEEVGETGLLPKPGCAATAERLLPGTILTRIYDDVEHQRAGARHANDFEYQRATIHQPLRRLAKVIAGCHMVRARVLRR